MNIGELFVNLGIKGSDKAVGALSDVKKGLGEVSSMSIEAKAGILAALYGLERLTAQSGATGTGLTNFAAMTGLSMKQLQQWQYAARQAGESSEDFTGSLKGVQNTVSNMLLGKGAPEGLGLVSRAVKDFDPTRLRDTFYVMTKLQEAAQKLPKDLGTQALKSFGLSEGAIAAMRRNAFTPEQLSKAPTYNDGEIRQLDKANIAWSNLGNKVEMLIGHLNAAHGGQLVNDITKIADAVFKLINALLVLADKLKVFTEFSKVLGFTADAIYPKKGSVLAEDHLEKKAYGWLKNKIFSASHGPEDLNEGSSNPFLPSKYKNPKPAAETSKVVAAPPKLVWGGHQRERAITPSPVPGVKNTNSSNVSINQNVHFHGEVDAPKKTSDALKKAAGDFVKQNPAKVQGS